MRWVIVQKKWNESGFRPPLCTYRLNWARRTSWGWWDDWDDTVLQTQDSKFESWRSEAEHATSRSRRLPTILTFTRGWGRNNFVSFKPPGPGTEPRTLAWKAAVLTTTLGPPPYTTQSTKHKVQSTKHRQVSPGDKEPGLLNHRKTAVWATSHQRKGQGLTLLRCALLSEQCVWNHHHWTVIFSQTSTVRRAISQASNVMIKSLLLKTKLMQCYDKVASIYFILPLIWHSSLSSVHWSRFRARIWRLKTSDSDV